MSFRRQRSIPLGGRYRQVSLYIAFWHDKPLWKATWEKALLTQLCLNKVTNISRKILLGAFYWMKIFQFRLQIQWNVFLWAMACCWAGDKPLPGAVLTVMYTNIHMYTSVRLLIVAWWCHMVTYIWVNIGTSIIMACCLTVQKSQCCCIISRVLRNFDFKMSAL